MTTKFTLKFTFHGFWHVSTGRGGGAALDMLSHRDADGLPCLPGRGVKGVLRDAVYRAEHWGYLGAGSTEAWFGTLTNDEEHRVSLLEAEPGCLFVSDAVVDPEVGEFLRYQKKTDPKDAETLLAGFFHPIAATAMQDGVAKNKSLRSIEVVIPLDLYAELEIRPELLPEKQKILLPKPEALRQCLLLIRAAGGGNNRGLGRVSVTLEEKS